MISGKLVTTEVGRRYMYAMLNRLGTLQNNAVISNGVMQTQYIGVLNRRAVTPKAEFEVLCDFIISFEALKLLETEGFGFYVDTGAYNNFDYELAGLTGVVPDTKTLTDFKSWVMLHNQQTDKKLTQYCTKH